MKKRACIIMLVFMAIGLVACGTMQSTEAEGKKGHKGLTEQQKLIACSDCHKEATPEIYSQWYNSTHGLDNVKCYQCHNTFGDLVKTPDISQSCNSCHADKVENADHTEGMLTCWECHNAHSFSVE